MSTTAQPTYSGRTAGHTHPAHAARTSRRARHAATRTPSAASVASVASGSEWERWLAQFRPEAQALFTLMIEVRARLAREAYEASLHPSLHPVMV